MPQSPEKADTLIERPLYGQRPSVYGQVLGTLFVQGPEQAVLLRKVVHDALKDYAGRHEETFLQKTEQDLTDMLSRARKEGWRGWEEPGGLIEIGP